MGSLLGVAAAIAAIAVGLRLLRRRAAEGARPGRRPDRPIVIRDYGEMDFAVGLQTCPCGGRFTLRGEGPGAGPHLRIAHLECRRCEREVSLYFDVSQVLH